MSKFQSIKYKFQILHIILTSLEFSNDKMVKNLLVYTIMQIECFELSWSSLYQASKQQGFWGEDQEQSHCGEG